ncbi:MAG: hypothetical protein M3014_09015, partial [Chloroflexota bacterium]|nr:hypothetical protein [Chloroflexota bacterium]
MASKSTPVVGNMIVRIVLLSYAGVALLQWLHAALLSGGEESEISPLVHWLRDSTMALPFVAGAVLFTARRYGVKPQSANLAGAALFACVMGAGSILHQIYPLDGHAAHEAGDISVTAIFQHTVV